MNGENPGDYGRRLLRVLYSEVKLKTSMLPATVSDRYLKPKLDKENLLCLTVSDQDIASFYSIELTMMFALLLHCHTRLMWYHSFRCSNRWLHSLCYRDHAH
jgi:hypothetical protein